jgi:hypothetical protein
MGKRVCPFCAEEIKDEALKCKHCGSVMPEVEARMEEEQRQAELEEQDQIEAMDAQHAKKVIYGGYWFFASGLILGSLIAYAVKLPWYVVFIIGYIVWSSYWGIRIVNRAVKSFYDHLFIFGTGIVDLFIRQIAMRVGMYLVTIPLSGLLFGSLGGAFIKQVQYQKLVNTSYDDQSRKQLLSFVPLVLIALILIVAGYLSFEGDNFHIGPLDHAKKNMAESIPVANYDAKNKVSKKTPSQQNTKVDTPEVGMRAERATKEIHGNYDAPQAGSGADDSSRNVGALAGANRTNPIPAAVSTAQSGANPRTAFVKSARDTRTDTVKSFVSDYLRANESKEMGKVLSFYGEKVDYHSKGVVPKSYIAKDKESFFGSWRMLSYSVPTDLQIASLERPDAIRLTFTCEYNMNTGNKTIKGIAKNTWDIETSGTNPKIIAEKQTMINKN